MDQSEGGAKELSRSPQSVYLAHVISCVGISLPGSAFSGMVRDPVGESAA
jgi:hypothetical protein